jgi:hypothetical protein
MVNVAKAGRTVPVKFSLDSYDGMDILEAGYPGSQQIDCDSLDTVDIAVGTVTAGPKGYLTMKAPKSIPIYERRRKRGLAPAVS